MIKIIFIRHGKTDGNLKKRYIGRTDESLCDEGINELKAHSYPKPESIICSSMKRCIQTAEIIYPNKKITIYDDLRECDFGDFEGKNYIELSDNSDYCKWIESGGELPFPNGEDHKAFKKRCVRAFEKAVSENQYDSIAFVVHGGTIMSILEKYAFPKKSFYDYQIKNGCGFYTEFDGEKIIIQGEIK